MYSYTASRPGAERNSNPTVLQNESDFSAGGSRQTADRHFVTSFKHSYLLSYQPKRLNSRHVASGRAKFCCVQAAKKNIDFYPRYELWNLGDFTVSATLWQQILARGPTYYI